MVVTNYTRNQLTLILGGSTTNVPTYFVLGSGSGVAFPTQTILINEMDRQLNTTISNTTQKVTWQGDWNSVEISGTDLLREVGITVSGAPLTGSIWSRTSLPALTFDGTNELRVEETWEAF